LAIEDLIQSSSQLDSVGSDFQEIEILLEDFNGSVTAIQRGSMFFKYRAVYKANTSKSTLDASQPLRSFLSGYDAY
jgi:hypothetical protein